MASDLRRRVDRLDGGEDARHRKWLSTLTDEELMQQFALVLPGGAEFLLLPLEEQLATCNGRLRAVIDGMDAESQATGPASA